MQCVRAIVDMLQLLYRRAANSLSKLVRHVERNAKSRTGKSAKQTVLPRTRQFTIALEGNIASGKTTFLEHLTRYLSDSIVHVMPEPVDKWRNVHGYNLLEMMYKDPQRWCMLLQTYVQLTMLELHMQKSPASVKIMERSIHSARNCFVENLYRSGVMPDAEYTVLCEWFNWISNHLDVGVDLIIYLRTTPEVVHERIWQRARGEENSISLDYLCALHQLHEDWLYHKTAFSVSSPVIILNANQELSQIQEDFKNLGIMKSIQKALVRHKNSTPYDFLSVTLNTQEHSEALHTPKWAQKRR